ncbi:hypothetical protein QZH41_005234 [Actinostola sp. cb2023]|nr:hypothetical protein QZH41_005234 [Actinostola sp. cb2023]
MKGGKTWAKKKARGSMRWERDEECLALQWVDNRLVTMLSTIDNANEYVTAQRKSKVGQKWTNMEVKQPKAVNRYNSYMNAVDSYILFEIHRRANPGMDELKRPKKYSVLEFREELVRDLLGFVQYGNPPLYNKLPKEPPKADTFHTDHMVEFDKVRRSCKLCYKKFKTRTKFSPSAVHLIVKRFICTVLQQGTALRNGAHGKDCDRS